ncbi:MAG: hypothetical protein ACYDAQ_20410 [Mycobacteriales bacterium]
MNIEPAAGGCDIGSGETTFTFGSAGVATAVACSSSTSCTATVPAGSGSVDVQASASGLISAVNAPADVFSYLNGWIPVGPYRLVDTRGGTGPQAQGVLENASGSLGARTLYQLPILGLDGIPASAVAVGLNLTSVEPNAVGNLRVFTDGASLPNSSALNYVPGHDVANFTLVALPADGKVDFYSAQPAGAHVDLVVDVVGYLTSSAGFHPQDPIRIADTRPTSKIGTTTGPLVGGTTYAFPVVGQGGVPASAKAVAVVVTAIGPSAPGNLRVYPDPASPPTASTINYTLPGQDEADFAVLALPADGKIDLYSDGPARLNVTIDVVGYFDASSHLASMLPVRLLDTRAGSGLAAALPSPLAANTPYKLKVTGVGGVPVGVESVLLNVTVINPTNAVGNLRIYPGDETSTPTISTVNLDGPNAVANFVIVRPAADGTITIYGAGAPTDVVIDIDGYFPNSG